MTEPIQHTRAPLSRVGKSARVANAIFVTGTLFGMGLMLFLLQVMGTNEEEDIEHYRDIRDLVLETFVGDVDEKQLLESSLRGMLHELDNYSDYYVEEQIAEINQDTSGHKVGIGVIMRYEDGPQILFPIQGSPAEAAGLHVGDEVLELDGTSVVGLTQAEIGDLMRGDAESTLRIRVRGLGGEDRDHEVQRRQLLIPSVRRVRFVDGSEQIGYIAVHSFTNATTSEFDAAIADLQTKGMRGLVLDLRGNQGGVLSAAVEIAQRFINEGLIASTEGRGEPHYEMADPNFTPYLHLPLVLLVDGHSASASEVLAGALQDHRAAVLVGEPTWGKGVVQTISRYPTQHAIAKITTSYYYTPTHRSLERGTGENAFGLLPDFHVPAKSGQRERLYLWFARPYDAHEKAAAELLAWQEASGLELGLNAPEDEQLNAAVAVLQGQAPTVAR